MCQQGQAEIYWSKAAELAAIHKEYKDHVSGEKPVSDERLQEMVVKIIMLRE